MVYLGYSVSRSKKVHFVEGSKITTLCGLNIIKRNVDYKLLERGVTCISCNKIIYGRKEWAKICQR